MISLRHLTRAERLAPADAVIRGIVSGVTRALIGWIINQM